MTYYLVVLYNVNGEEIVKKQYKDYRQANDFIFSSQFENEDAAGGKILRITELRGEIVLEKCLVFGMWTPFENQDLVNEYIKFMRG